MKELYKEPMLPINSIDEAILQIRGSPGCKNSNCHGKGYIGIRCNQDGSKTLILCQCGRWQETDWIKFRHEIEFLKLQNIQLYDYLNKMQTEFIRETFFGKLKWYIKKIIDQIKSKTNHQRIDHNNHENKNQKGNNEGSCR